MRVIRIVGNLQDLFFQLVFQLAYAFVSGLCSRCTNFGSFSISSALVVVTVAVVVLLISSVVVVVAAVFIALIVATVGCFCRCYGGCCSGGLLSWLLPLFLSLGLG